VAETKPCRWRTPNRDFFDLRLDITKRIADFTVNTLCTSYRNIIIISAHSAFKPELPDLNNEALVFPGYKLTESGKEKEKMLIRTKTGGIKLDSGDYYIPANSENLARRFSKLPGFAYTAIWNNEIYPGEYLNYLEKNDREITAIEFEVRKALTRNEIESKWKTAYEDFLQELLLDLA
jgi:hypothetical protein